MHLCYVDESGNDQLLDSYEAPPVLVIAGVTVAQARLDDFVWAFLKLKQEFNPQAATGKQLTDTIRYEVKGSDLRADLRSTSRNRRRRAARFMGQVVTLLEQFGASIDGEIWVKADGGGVPQAFYPSAIAGIAKNFNAQLAAAGTNGLMILDARTKNKNVPSVHGITTRRFKSGGNQLPRLVESPVFGHSDAHVALQVADIVASALPFPIACSAYCQGLSGNAHAHPAYDSLRPVFGARLRNLENRYTDADGQRLGGIAVRDKRGNGASLEMYREPNGASVKRERPPRTRTRAGEPVERSEALSEP